MGGFLMRGRTGKVGGGPLLDGKGWIAEIAVNPMFSVGFWAGVGFRAAVRRIAAKVAKLRQSHGGAPHRSIDETAIRSRSFQQNSRCV
jgi:hypothetical protein